MRRVAAVAVLLLSLTTFGSKASAQNARERQAAAEAYDRGTTAYVAQDYGEAAVWFETANRMAPAAPALMQAIRAHEKNENYTRAATLALDLQRTYRDDTNAESFANEVLEKYAGTLVKVEVNCDEDCKLDVDGKLEEYLTFFVTPDEEHTITATFETGSKVVNVHGTSGESQEVAIKAPPPPPVKPIAIVPTPTDTTKKTQRHPPLPPLATWIGLGLTVALGGATVAAGIYALHGVPAYKDAVSAAEPCLAMPASTRDQACNTKIQRANDLLDNGKSRELRTNILIGATAVAAVGTGVIALLFTDWSGGHEHTGDQTTRSQSLPRVELLALPGGAATVLKGRF